MIPLPLNIARIWDARAGQGVLIGFLSQSPPATRLNCRSDPKEGATEVFEMAW